MWNEIIVPGKPLENQSIYLMLGLNVNVSGLFGNRFRGDHACYTNIFSEKFSVHHINSVVAKSDFTHIYFFLLISRKVSSLI